MIKTSLWYGLDTINIEPFSSCIIHVPQDWIPTLRHGLYGVKNMTYRTEWKLNLNLSLKPISISDRIKRDNSVSQWGTRLDLLRLAAVHGWIEPMPSFLSWKYPSCTGSRYSRSPFFSSHQRSNQTPHSVWGIQKTKNKPLKKNLSEHFIQLAHDCVALVPVE